ncbi:unnamed protein product [Schistosoma mattheei]|uniref:Uncharacterized protein n=1 Tax=Schistosoma mattheei TaxID=31246 RepID=A0A183PMF0_9TREM|nr:unnamed protein product [Schistosoma mattheei]
MFHFHNAPNSYNIDDGLTYRLDFSQLGKCVGFGSTAKRMNDKLVFGGKFSGGLSDIPGPGQYNPQKCDGKYTSKAVGIPKAKREISMPQSSVPPPGTYDFGKSFDVTQCKRIPAVPRTIEGPAKYYILENKPQKGKFVYQSERFKETEKEQLPGPADYEKLFMNSKIILEAKHCGSPEFFINKHLVHKEFSLFSSSSTTFNEYNT